MAGLSRRANKVKNKMRILVVATQINVPGQGGGQTHVTELTRNLRRYGGPTLLLGRYDSHGEDVVGVGLKKGLPFPGTAHIVSGLNLPRSLRACKKFKPDVIYERGSSYGLGSYLSALLNIPMLVMLLDEHISPLSLIRAKKIITTNPALVPASFKHKTVQVSWGANHELFKPGIDAEAVRKEYGLKDAFVVGYTGTLQAWHGLDTLIDAAKTINDETVRFLLIGGTGNRLSRLKEKIDAAEVRDKFVLTGRVDYERVPTLLSAADVCVAPFDPSGHSLSKKRGYSLDPLKLFEYLAMAKPTITIRAGNIESLFEDSVHLQLFEANNHTELADRIMWAKNHLEEAKNQALAGREKVLEKHTWASHANHLVHLFTEMLDESSEAR